VRQTLHEWLRETSLPVWPTSASAPTDREEGIDALNTQQSDLDFKSPPTPRACGVSGSALSGMK